MSSQSSIRENFPKSLPVGHGDRSVVPKSVRRDYSNLSELLKEQKKTFKV
jgi:hypothetical protein